MVRCIFAHRLPATRVVRRCEVNAVVDNLNRTFFRMDRVCRGVWMFAHLVECWSRPRLSRTMDVFVSGHSGGPKSLDKCLLCVCQGFWVLTTYSRTWGSGMTNLQGGRASWVVIVQRRIFVQLSVLHSPPFYRGRMVWWTVGQLAVKK